MNAQRAYEYVKNLRKDDEIILKGLIEALTGEPEKVEPPVKVGDRVKFSDNIIKDGIGEVCCVDEDGNIKVGLDAKFNNYGWMWHSEIHGSDHAKKRGFKYGWVVPKGNYTIIGRA